MIGERLFPKISKFQPEFASKITGMILEMDNNVLLIALESETQMKSWVEKATSVLLNGRVSQCEVGLTIDGDPREGARSDFQPKNICTSDVSQIFRLDAIDTQINPSEATCDVDLLDVHDKVIVADFIAKILEDTMGDLDDDDVVAQLTNSMSDSESEAKTLDEPLEQDSNEQLFELCMEALEQKNLTDKEVEDTEEVPDMDDFLATLESLDPIHEFDNDQRLIELSMAILEQRQFTDIKLKDVEEVPSMDDFLATLFRGPYFLVNKLLDELEECMENLTDPGEGFMATLNVLMAKIESNEDLMTARDRIDIIHSADVAFLLL